MNDQTLQSTNLSEKEKKERELDRLHIQWILGKNRGAKTLLSADKLALLVSSKRISLTDLSIGEQELVSQIHESEGKQIESEKSKSGGRQEIENPIVSAVVNMLNSSPRKNATKESRDKAKMLVTGLCVLTKKRFKDMFAEEWNNLSKEQASYALSGFFIQLYGMSWQEMEEALARRL